MFPKGVSHVGDARVLRVEQDELLGNPEEMARQLHQFLGVRPEFHIRQPGAKNRSLLSQFPGSATSESGLSPQAEFKKDGIYLESTMPTGATGSDGSHLVASVPIDKLAEDIEDADSCDWGSVKSESSSNS